MPQASVAVKVTVADPVAPHDPVSDVKLLLHVTPLHTSLADAPPFDPNHAFNCDVLPDPSHSTVLLPDATSIDGDVVS